MIVFRVSPAERPLPNPKAPPQPSPRGGSSNWSPSPTLPKGRELILAVFEAVGCGSFPLGKAGMGLLWWTERTPGNSVGVAFPQPRVEVRSASTLGINIIRWSNAVSVALSRRRYSNANPSPPICRGIILPSITPTAKRNSYRVAKIVRAATQGRGATRLNPGL